MAEFITPQAARAALRVGDEVGDETLQSLIATATRMVANRMQRPILGEGGWAGDAVPEPVIQAIKSVLVVLYDNPDAPVVDDEALLNMIGNYCRPSFA